MIVIIFTIPYRKRADDDANKGEKYMEIFKSFSSLVLNDERRDSWFKILNSKNNRSADARILNTIHI